MVEEAQPPRAEDQRIHRQKEERKNNKTDDRQKRVFHTVFSVYSPRPRIRLYSPTEPVDNRMCMDYSHKHARIQQ